MNLQAFDKQLLEINRQLRYLVEQRQKLLAKECNKVFEIPIMGETLTLTAKEMADIVLNQIRKLQEQRLQIENKLKPFCHEQKRR